MIKIFVGFETRQPVALQVLSHSIYRRATAPVAITPLVLSQLPIKRKGLTEFTFSRYLVPYLCCFKGRAVFMDADMLCLGDVAELVALAREDCAVSVVDAGINFERPSLMVFNCEMCEELTPEYIETQQPQSLKWAKRGGLLPDEWNHLVGYNEPREDAKLVHFTAGLPIWPETEGCEYAKEWHDEFNATVSSVTWKELMGNSVHAQMVLNGGLKRKVAA